MIIKLFSNQFDRVYFSAKNTVYGLKKVNRRSNNGTTFT